MEILLIVAIAVVAAAALYVAATFNMRTRKNAAPLVEEAVKKISDQVLATEDNMRRQLRALSDSRQQDLEQQRLESRKTQYRLDAADSRLDTMASQLKQLLAGLDTIQRRAETDGEQQRQFGTGLQRLDQRVARLAEGLGQAAGPAAAPEPRGPAPAGAGLLYVQRIRFWTVPAQSAALGKPRVRIEVERAVAEWPAGQLAGLGGDSATVIDRAEKDQGFRDRLGEAAADYAAGRWADPAFTAMTDRWVTQDTFPETAAAQVCDRIGEGLNVIVAKPLGALATELRLPGPAAAAVGGIGADLILLPVTKPLGQAAEFFEIVGVVVGLATGFHPLALAAAKMLAHDKFHDLAARGIREAAGRVFRGRPPVQTAERIPAAPAGPRIPAAPAGPRIAAAPVPVPKTPTEPNPAQPRPAVQATPPPGAAVPANPPPAPRSPERGPGPPGSLGRPSPAPRVPGPGLR